ncbi:putative periplasmic protein [Neisseria meningitidis 98002]|nr:putative periplasmic protein [Neisseria meningitidis 96060]EOC48282.1 putative periplasmic protein [Neisseria meningitidis 2005172]EPF53229.1 putative periplasmic protein [Neisseria meningitidis 98002]
MVLPLVCGHSMVLVMQRQADQLLLEMLLLLAD